MIKLRALYQENIQSAEQKGIQTGIQEGIKQGIETGVQSERRTTLGTIFSARFGSIDPELTTVIDKAIALPTSEYSQLLPQLFSLSCEDLLKQLENLGS
jgi:flagellar biosynthesis/type III secretory pathway protein FliH